MIRVVAIVSLTSLLVLVLYLPSAQPPERFVLQVRAEHARAIEVWGPVDATRILDRMLALQDTATEVSPGPAGASAPQTAGVDEAVGHEMARVNQRLFNNPYFRSIDALLTLASYRLSALLEWLPRAWILALALAADALLERAVKSKEFRHHDPERFALYASGAILTVCACVLAMVWPWTLHPAAWAVAPIVVALLLSRAIAHYHRRG